MIEHDDRRCSTALAEISTSKGDRDLPPRFRTNQVVLDFSRVSERLTLVRLPEYVKSCQERFVKITRLRGNCGGTHFGRTSRAKLMMSRASRYSLRSTPGAGACRVRRWCAGWWSANASRPGGKWAR